MEVVEHLIVGAGPAGLRAAQVLAEAGREVLVLEKRPGDRPEDLRRRPDGRRRCASSSRSGCPPGHALASLGHVAFAGGRPVVLDPELDRWCTRFAPARLGRLPARMGPRRRRRGAGRARRPPRSICRAAHRPGGRPPHPVAPPDRRRRRRLGRPPRPWPALAADLLRRRVQPPRPAARASADRVRSGRDSPTATSGSFRTATTPRSAPSRPSASSRRPCSAATSTRRSMASASPAEACRSRERRSRWPITACHFAGGVHLAGDAAGVTSSLTAEGIYAALVTGEEVARTILEPRAPAPKTSALAPHQAARTIAWPAGSPGRRSPGRPAAARQHRRDCVRSGGRSPPGS